jgi:hypothetical protein
MNLCVWINPAPAAVPKDVILRDRDHAARPGARIADGDHHALTPDAIFVSRQKQVHHEMNDITRRKVFAGVFIEGFVELPDQLLENCSHGRVIDDIRV